MTPALTQMKHHGKKKYVTFGDMLKTARIDLLSSLLFPLDDLSTCEFQVAPFPLNIIYIVFMKKEVQFEMSKVEFVPLWLIFFLIFFFNTTWIVQYPCNNAGEFFCNPSRHQRKPWRPTGSFRHHVRIRFRQRDIHHQRA